MEAHRFQRLARFCATGISRRRMLGGIGGGLAALRLTGTRAASESEEFVITALPVRPDALPQLRAFGNQVAGSLADQARRGWTAEGTRREVAFVVGPADAPIFVVVQLVANAAQAATAFAASPYEVDRKFTQLLYAVARAAPETPERIWDGGTDATTIAGPAPATPGA